MLFDMRFIVFDLDGTLLNTLEDIRASINYARKAFDGEPISLDDTKRYIGSGLRKALTSSIVEHGPRLENEDEEDLMFQLLMQYYRNHPSPNTVLYKGIPELIATLKSHGYGLAILSNKADDIVQKIWPNFFEEGTFDVIQGKLPDYPLKPDKAVVDRLFDRLKCNKEDVALIGDSEVDYKTAINSGLRHIIVNYGFRTKDTLLKQGIDSIDHVPSLGEIEALWT